MDENEQLGVKKIATDAIISKLSQGSYDDLHNRIDESWDEQIEINGKTYFAEVSVLYDGSRSKYGQPLRITASINFDKPNWLGVYKTVCSSFIKTQ